MIARITAAAVSIACAACAGSLPETHYYQLAPPTSGGGGRGGGMLMLETLATDAAYDDERVVYRTSPFRLDYYQYHRWSSAPGAMVSSYLEQAFEQSGRFRAVVRDATFDAPVALAGRVIALEEVDRSKVEWIGRIVLVLFLTDARTGEVLWTEHFDEAEPLRQQTPEGLAAAISVAMSRIVAHTTPVIADLADRRAHLRAEHPPRRPPPGQHPADVTPARGRSAAALGVRIRPTLAAGR